MTIEGGCRCGAVRHELATADLPLTYACHCLDCQTWSGTAFALHAMSSDDALSIRGSLHGFRLPGGQEAIPTFEVSPTPAEFAAAVSR